MDFLVSAGKMKSSDSREIFATAFELLNIAEGSKRSYEKIVQNNSSETNLAKHLIYLYYEFFETNYESMIYNFKKKYIENEARVEYNNENFPTWLGIENDARFNGIQFKIMSFCPFVFHRCLYRKIRRHAVWQRVGSFVLSALRAGDLSWQSDQYDSLGIQLYVCDPGKLFPF